MPELCHLYYPGQYGASAVTHLGPQRRVSWPRPGAVKRVPVEHRASLCRDGFLEAAPVAELAERHGATVELVVDLAAELSVPIEQYQPAEGEPYAVVVLDPRLLARLSAAPPNNTKARRGRKE